MKTLKSTTALLLVLALAACSSSGTPVVPRPTPTPNPTPTPLPASDPATWLTTEFNRNWGLRAIGAEYAYAEGYTGAGQIIGFVDFNFNLSSPEVNYATGSLDKVQSNIDIYEAQIGKPAVSEPHGHAVAVVAAGVKNDIATHGVAPGAKVLAVDYFSGIYNQNIMYEGSLYHVSDPYTYLIDKGARVVSISIGYDDEDIIPNPPSVGEKYVVDYADNVVTNGGLLLAAAGNNSDTKPQLSNLEILRRLTEGGWFTTGTGAYLIVGSVDQNNVISSFSDRAGAEAMDHYLVAPGENIVAPWVDKETGDTKLYYLLGTSFAAPHVAGAAAILFQRWPYLSAKEVARILLDTATDLGAVGVDVIYGHGLLNLKEAIKPQGQTTASVYGAPSPVSVNDFALHMGAAFGNAKPQGLSKLLAIDGYGRDFYFDLSSGVSPSLYLQQPINDFFKSSQNLNFNQWQAGSNVFGLQVREEFKTGALENQSQFVRDHNVAQKPVSGFVEGQVSDNLSWQLGLGMGAAFSLDQQKTADLHLLSDLNENGFLASSGNHGVLNYQLGQGEKIRFALEQSQRENLQDNNFNTQQQPQRTTWAVQMDKEGTQSGLSWRIGQMFEQGGLLGSYSYGGFAVANKTLTSFMGLEGHWQILDHISFNIGAEAGVSKVDTVRGSYFEGFNVFWSSAWHAQITAQGMGFKNSFFILSARQPLRVENASLTRHEAVAIDTTSRQPIYELRSTNFTPDGREVALEAAYKIIGDQWSLQTSLLHRFNAGHNAARQENAALIYLQRRF